MTADKITAIKEALEGVTHDDAIGFINTAMRNWSHVPKIDADDLLDLAEELQRFSERRYTPTLESLQRENEELRKKLAGCDWYWPEDDTSSDACADSPWEIAEIYDLKPADILAYSRGGVVETRYFAFLPPADDSDSDDNFEVDEVTEEAVAVKITAEIERRTALASTGGEHHAE